MARAPDPWQQPPLCRPPSTPCPQGVPGRPPCGARAHHACSCGRCAARKPLNRLPIAVDLPASRWQTVTPMLENGGSADSICQQHLPGSLCVWWDGMVNGAGCAQGTGCPVSESVGTVQAALRMLAAQPGSREDRGSRRRSRRSQGSTRLRPSSSSLSAAGGPLETATCSVHALYVQLAHLTGASSALHGRCRAYFAGRATGAGNAAGKPGKSTRSPRCAPSRYCRPAADLCGRFLLL